MLGTTALQIFNETVSVPWAVMKWTEFYKHETCGKCTPCREGTYWLVQILERMLHREGTPADVETLLDAATTSSAARSARSVTARPARSPAGSSTSARSSWTCAPRSPSVALLPDQLPELTGASA